MSGCLPLLGSTAYLAYTCLEPEDAKSLREVFQHNRLNNIQEWLADLASVLPEHTGRAVAISLDLWQQAIPDPGPTPWTMPPTTIAALHRQAKLWQGILTGAKEPRDMLNPSAYITAAAEMLANTRRLLGHLLWRYLPAVILMVLLLLGAVAVVILVGPVGKVFAALLPIVAALGLTSRGLIAALRAAASKLEQPLWGAELDTSIAAAITVAPGLASAKVAKKTAKSLTPAGPAPVESEPARQQRALPH